MRRMRLWVGIGLIALVIGVAANAGSRSQSEKLASVVEVKEFVHDWQISKQFTIDVANAMPAEFYDFKPNPEEMSFGEQMIHIAESNVFRFNQITGIPGPFALDPAKPHAADKATAVKLLEQSFDYVIAAVPQITTQELQRTWNIPSWKGRNNPDGRAMILNMFVHTAHHRAQCEVYMRVKGIKPPDYTF
ncbi:MAG TPA: DinB family protein [Candidatus Acidoferrales bacterium]|nr:DinB family protein [Candidatus Acidoferrales bacterium]